MAIVILNSCASTQGSGGKKKSHTSMSNSKDKSKSSSKSKSKKTINTKTDNSLKGKKIDSEGSFYGGLVKAGGPVYREALLIDFIKHYGVTLGKDNYKKVMLTIGRGKTFDRYSGGGVFKSMCYRAIDGVGAMVFDGFSNSATVTRVIFYDTVSGVYGLNLDNCLEVRKIKQNISVSGIKRKMTMADIKKRLGEPTYTAPDYIGYKYESYSESGLIEVVFDREGLKNFSVYRNLRSDYW